MANTFQIVSGTSGRVLTHKIAGVLHVPCNEIKMTYFPDGEIGVKDIVINPDEQIF